MAKRKLSHQQKRRIQQAQQSINLDDENTHQGFVISHHGGEVEIQPCSENAHNIHCKLRTNLGVIVCGDQVFYRQENNDLSIIALHPRRNLLQRMDGFGQLKAVAANVTQLLICLAIEPEPNLFLLDQYLLSAEQQQIEVIIVLNKIDLADQHDSDPFRLKAIYQPLGYEVLPVSIIDHLNIETLQQHCVGHVNVISGVSGVGKSSITKAILPEVEIPIGEISEVNREGKHTTRTSRLYHLPLGGQLIDTPGVRGFNPVYDKNMSIASGFREISQHAQLCRFSNCKHINEPKCAVLDALKSGQIDGGRYESYLKLLNESQA
ncbi:MAG: ribosome small subunit-dependent GTPase A [Gammaproteobacteria bacterium]|nr:ribosome small subunit-dependent GTPase A [Gammaproteobacteria bacterium]